MSPLASVLAGVRGERIALSDVSVSATLRDLLGEVTVCQTYRNDEDVNIEAVYTFPLPLDAVLLDLRVQIGGRTLNGVVVEKKAAEEKYEDAVAAGDAAVMLEAIEPGLYTMNVGNLLPKEAATITFVYAIVCTGWRHAAGVAADDDRAEVWDVASRAAPDPRVVSYGGKPILPAGRSSRQPARGPIRVSLPCDDIGFVP